MTKIANRAISAQAMVDANRLRHVQQTIHVQAINFAKVCLPHVLKMFLKVAQARLTVTVIESVMKANVKRLVRSVLAMLAKLVAMTV